MPPTRHLRLASSCLPESSCRPDSCTRDSCPDPAPPPFSLPQLICRNRPALEGSIPKLGHARPGHADRTAPRHACLAGALEVSGYDLIIGDLDKKSLAIAGTVSKFIGSRRWLPSSSS